MSPISLYELNNMVRSVLEQSFEDDVWVVGEMAEGRLAANGHFYGQLVQRDELYDRVLAKASFTIWARSYQQLRYRFEKETGETLRAGLKLLLKVHICFHEQYGYSLNVVDIDPSYTMGDMARRRLEIIRQLTEDGIIDDNCTLELPMLLKRIAVISSDKAAGYGDFCDQLINNDYGLNFHVQLFPAMMQGNRVEETVLAAFDAIADEIEKWDAVVIIRGGGATSDLSDFDSYPLAACIAQFPLPVLVGIGHERDETVLDRVANQSLKTPTAVAAFLLDHQAQLAARLDDLQQALLTMTQQKLERERQRLERYSTVIPLAFSNVRQREEHRWTVLQQRLQSAWTMRRERQQMNIEQTILRLSQQWQARLEREQHRHELLEQRLKGLDPALLLKRGYTITRVGNRIIRNIEDLQPGDVLSTQFEQGEVLSKVLMQCDTGHGDA